MIHVAEQFFLRRAAVLCARKGSIYHTISGVDVYCKRRPVSEFVGCCPVVCHPPCRLWGRLRQFAKSTQEQNERYLARLCCDHVRHYGGVLEHPAYSTLWRDQGLPLPGEKSPEGCTIAIPQYWFGHRGRKATWLFVARLQVSEIPLMPYRLEAFDRVGVADGMGRSEREHTPAALAEWLVALAVISGDRPRYRWDGSEKRPAQLLKDRAGMISKDAIRPEQFLKQLELSI
jgi:hypothetical protein